MTLWTRVATQGTTNQPTRFLPNENTPIPEGMNAPSNPVRACPRATRLDSNPGVGGVGTQRVALILVTCAPIGKFRMDNPTSRRNYWIRMYNVTPPFFVSYLSSLTTHVIHAKYLANGFMQRPLVASGELEVRWNRKHIGPNMRLGMKGHDREGGEQRICREC